jgi:hypothetical protein
MPDAFHLPITGGREKKMKNLIKEWGFPVVLLTLWIIAAGYTLQTASTPMAPRAPSASVRT